MGATGMFSEKSYLYVEDDFPSRIVLQKLLKSLGVTRLTVFEDSTDFMSRVKALQERPDIILLDIHMKPHNGFEMLKMLRDDPEFADRTIIALTASVMNEEVNLLRASSFNGVIAKPIQMTALPKLLERIAAGEAIWEVV
jgi:CheY-like chemotaxis protein